MKSFFAGISFLFVTLFTAQAQRNCGSMNYMHQLTSANPSLNETFGSIEKQINSVYKKNKGNFALRDTTPMEIIHIPVVIHVLYHNAIENISDAQIRSQLAALNADFRRQNADQANTPGAFKTFAGDARIEFCLAQVDQQGRSTSGIERKYTSLDSFRTDDVMKMPLKGGLAAWDAKHYLNIWICKLGSASVGYATPPGVQPDLDGVVIAYDAFGTTGTLRPVFNKGRTATHEIGHWLGLIHLWGDDNCGDDHVDDTPTQQSFNFGCQNFPKLSPCSPDANGDMFMNFMDFSDDACMNMFTAGQVKRMRALFADEGVRNSFLSSFACDSTLAQGGSLPVADTAKAPAVSLASTRIYPSPFQSVTTIECKAASVLSIKKVDIFSSTGMRVQTTSLHQEKTTIDLSKLAAGIYIVRVGDGKEIFTSKIVKQ